MILTEQEISLLAHNIDDGDWNDLNYQKCWHEGFVAGARAIESAVLEKLKAQEPVGHYLGENKGGADCVYLYCDLKKNEVLYRHPLPPDDVVRVAELEAVLRECWEVIERAKIYCESPRWSPAIVHDCNTIITKINGVLK